MKVNIYLFVSRNRIVATNPDKSNALSDAIAEVYDIDMDDEDASIEVCSIMDTDIVDIAHNVDLSLVDCIDSMEGKDYDFYNI